MAGGPKAETVTCLVCEEEANLKTPAVRVYEGSETDQYLCERGHRFGIDWRGREAGSEDDKEVRR